LDAFPQLCGAGPWSKGCSARRIASFWGRGNRFASFEKAVNSLFGQTGAAEYLEVERLREGRVRWGSG